MQDAGRKNDLSAGILFGMACTVLVKQTEKTENPD